MMNGHAPVVWFVVHCWRHLQSLNVVRSPFVQVSMIWSGMVHQWLSDATAKHASG